MSYLSIIQPILDGIALTKVGVFIFPAVLQLNVRHHAKLTAPLSSYSLWILGFEPVEQCVLVEGSSGGTVAVVSLDVGDGVRVFHHLNKSHLVPSG